MGAHIVTYYQIMLFFASGWFLASDSAEFLSRWAPCQDEMPFHYWTLFKRMADLKVMK